VAQYAFPIAPTHRADDVFRKASDTAGSHIVEVMDEIEEEGLHGTPQDPELATYDKKVKTEGLFLDWSQPAEDLERFTRACLPFMAPRFKHGHRTVYIYRAKFDPEPVDAEPGTVLDNRRPVSIATGKGTLKIVVAMYLPVFPWVWPAPWNRPKPGERMG